MLSLAKDVTRPTMLVFDLDPGEPATIVECARVGVALRDVFSDLGLDAYPKTSGASRCSSAESTDSPVRPVVPRRQRVRPFERAEEPNDVIAIGRVDGTVGVDRVGNRLVGPARLVLIDHRGPRGVVPHARHILVLPS